MKNAVLKLLNVNTTIHESKINLANFINIQYNMS
jgi:hypothetical protein